MADVSPLASWLSYVDSTLDSTVVGSKVAFMTTNMPAGSLEVDCCYSTEVTGSSTVVAWLCLLWQLLCV